MRKLTYLAIFEPTETGYSVYFPDLPGCVSTGSNFEDAEKMAKEALGLHVYGMEQDGDELPDPSREVKPDPESADGCLTVPICIFPDLVKNELDNRKVKTNVTIPNWLKQIGEREGVSFSKLLETALRDYLQV